VDAEIGDTMLGNTVREQQGKLAGSLARVAGT